MTATATAATAHRRHQIFAMGVIGIEEGGRGSNSGGRDRCKGGGCTSADKDRDELREGPKGGVVQFGTVRQI